MPSVSKAVVIIRVRRETARGASARAIARKIRAEEAIEIVVRVDPVLIDAVVGGQDVTVWSVTSGRGDRQQVIGTVGNGGETKTSIIRARFSYGAAEGGRQERSEGIVVGRRKQCSGVISIGEAAGQGE